MFGQRRWSTSYGSTWARKKQIVNTLIPITLLLFTEWIGNFIAEQLGVPTSYVVRHAAFVYETQLRGIHQQLRINVNNSTMSRNSAKSPTPSKPRPSTCYFNILLLYNVNKVDLFSFYKILQHFTIPTTSTATATTWVPRAVFPTKNKQRIYSKVWVFISSFQGKLTLYKIIFNYHQPIQK